MAHFKVDCLGRGACLSTNSPHARNIFMNGMLTPISYFTTITYDLTGPKFPPHSELAALNEPCIRHSLDFAKLRTIFLAHDIFPQGLPRPNISHFIFEFSMIQDT